jgi:hypothetical protein
MKETQGSKASLNLLPESENINGSEHGDILDDVIGGEEFHEPTPVNDVLLHMEECKNGRFRRVSLIKNE